MSSEREPIPREALPPGWGPTERGDERIAYRHDGPSIELIAACTAADRSHPVLGLSRCWELRVRYAIGDRPVTECVGRVSTRRAALDGLLRCMRRIHESVEHPNESRAVTATLERLSFEGVVPGYTPE